MPKNYLTVSQKKLVFFGLTLKTFIITKKKNDIFAPKIKKIQQINQFFTLKTCLLIKIHLV